MELVSVNLTTYNRSSLLPRAVASVLRQKYSHWELIIVDDGSTDSTREILTKLARSDNRIRPFFHGSNQGNAAARNTAWRQSRGKYIAFLDDDDEWITADKLNRQVKIFSSSPDSRLAIVCSGVNLISSAGQVQPRHITPPRDLISHILSRNGIIYSPTVLTRRDVLKQAGGFDTHLKRGIDSEFYRTCIVKLGRSVHFMPEITTNVHLHSAPRLTPSNSVGSIAKNIHANLYLLYKYFPQFLSHPKSAFFRLKNLSLLTLQMCTLPFVRITRHG